MRKIIVSIHSSFDGIVTGPKNDERNFATWAQDGIGDVMEMFPDLFETVDTILLGRGTYEDLSTRWPLVKEWPNTNDTVLRLGELVNNTPKLVVTSQHGIGDLKWGTFDAPKKLAGPDIEEQISQLKNQEGGDIVTFGSPILVQSLTNANLVDDYRILVHPVIVGEGRHLFSNITERKDLRLKSIRTFNHGASLVHYELAQSQTQAKITV